MSQSYDYECRKRRGMCGQNFRISSFFSHSMKIPNVRKKGTFEKVGGSWKCGRSRILKRTGHLRNSWVPRNLKNMIFEKNGKFERIGGAEKVRTNRKNMIFNKHKTFEKFGGIWQFEKTCYSKKRHTQKIGRIFGVVSAAHSYSYEYAQS